MDEKDKKIGELRSLLAAAKTKIDELKASLQGKDKQLTELKAGYEKKIKDLQMESEQIIRQYAERQLRYQKSLEESQNLVTKYQAQAQANSRLNEQTSQALTQIGNITMRIFTLNKVKDNSEAVEELCNLEKCKQFAEEVEKIEKNEDLAPAIKSILKLTDLVAQSLTKKREARLIFIKKETQLKKQAEEEQERNRDSTRRILELQKQLKNSQAAWKVKLAEANQSRQKVAEERANVEFIKQLLLKIFIGPKQASAMALEVLAKVLNMTADEAKLCGKRLK